MLACGVIFLVAFWICHSTAFWPPPFPISWLLIVMLVSYAWKAVFLLLFGFFFFFTLALNYTWTHQLLQLMCLGKIVFFLPKVVVLFVCFCFYPCFFDLWLNIFHQMWEIFSHYLFKSFFWLFLSLLLLGLITCMFCMLDGIHRPLRLYFCFFNLFSSVFFRNVLSIDLSLSLQILFSAISSLLLSPSSKSFSYFIFHLWNFLFIASICWVFNLHIFL